MAERPRQLLLDLPVEARLGIDDFMVGASNADAFGLIDAWPRWPGPVLRLQGPVGAGKSHLAAIWAARIGARVVSGAELALAGVPALAASPALVVEDADRTPLDEAAFFHILNQAREEARPLLITSRAGPDLWGLHVRDLLSRLRLAPAVTVEAPDDALLRAVIVKLFFDRQLVVDTAVVDFLMPRIERSFAAAADIVRRIDELALTAGRRVTRPLAAAALAELEGAQA